MPCSRRVSSAFFCSSSSSRALARSSARATSLRRSSSCSSVSCAHAELQLLGLELRLLAEGVGVALRVFEQRLGLQGVGLGPHPGELLLQEESDRSAYEKRGHDGDRNHEDVHETTSSPRTAAGYVRSGAGRGRAPVGKSH